LDVFRRVGPAFLHDVDAVVAGHVEKDTPSDDAREVVEPKFGQPLRIGEVFNPPSTVVEVVYSGVAETIHVRADAKPAHENFVVIGEGVIAETAGARLVRLEDRHAENPGRKGGRLPVDDDAEAVHLAFGHQLDGLQYALRRHAVRRTDLILGPPWRRQIFLVVL